MNQPLNTSASSYRMPGEFEPHAGCMMAWPSVAAAWGEDSLAAVQADFVNVAHAIGEFEPVSMVVAPDALARARNLLGSAVTLIAQPLTEAWFRDTGPSIVQQADGSLAGVCWQFNGWGEYSPDFVLDIPLAGNVLKGLDIPVVRSSLRMEGGALHVDGEGTMMSTETVVFNKNRNPGISREAAEAEFARTLGVQKVLWLPGSHVEKGTDGHIDGIACFVRPGVILFETSASSRQVYRDITARNFEALQGQTDAQGRKIELLFVQEAPDERANADATWGTSTSYINFYLANGGVVMPKFGIPRDQAALETIQAVFPERRVIQVDIRNLGAGGGGIHCITQQLPRPLSR